MLSIQPLSNLRVALTNTAANLQTYKTYKPQTQKRVRRSCPSVGLSERRKKINRFPIKTARARPKIRQPGLLTRLCQKIDLCYIHFFLSQLFVAVHAFDPSQLSGTAIELYRMWQIGQIIREQDQSFWWWLEVKASHILNGCLVNCPRKGRMKGLCSSTCHYLQKTYQAYRGSKFIERHFSKEVKSVPECVKSFRKECDGINGKNFHFYWKDDE